MHMFARMAGLAGAYGTPPMAFRAGNNADGVSSVVKPAGIAVGDLALVIANQYATAGATLTTAGGGAWTGSEIIWTVSGLNYKSTLFWKVLNATDVANGWTLSQTADVAAVAYVNPSVATGTVKATTQNVAAQTTLALAGFSPSVASRGAVAVIIDRDPDAADTAPSGWTARQRSTLGGSWEAAFADPATPYFGGNVAWTGVNGAGNFAEIGWLMEFT